MRALLVREWPALSYLFDLKPWHADLLSVAELMEYRRQAAEWMKAQKK